MCIRPSFCSFVAPAQPPRDTLSADPQYDFALYDFMLCAAHAHYHAPRENLSTRVDSDIAFWKTTLSTSTSDPAPRGGTYIWQRERGHRAGEKLDRRRGERGVRGIIFRKQAGLQYVLRMRPPHAHAHAAQPEYTLTGDGDAGTGQRAAGIRNGGRVQRPSSSETAKVLVCVDAG